MFFCVNIIAYCQENWYVRLALYTDLFTLSVLKRYASCTVIVVLTPKRKIEKYEKLVCNLYDKKNYVILKRYTR